MATIDSSIALATKLPQINDPAEVYGQGLKLSGMLQQNQTSSLALETARRNQQQEIMLNDMYKSAVGPDGQVDQNALMARMAQSGLGSKIPGVTKGFADLAKTAAETKKIGVDTAASQTGIDKNLQEMLHKGLLATDAAISGMLADPNVTDVKVASELGRLVRLGAFDAQAKIKGVTPDAAAKEVMSTMPVGNPAALRNWLVEAGMRTADASKRLEVALPKYDAQQRGGTVNEGTLNPLTGQRTPGKDITLTPSPESVLSANTTVRGQNLTDARGRELNAITRAGVDVQKEAQRVQIVDTPEGPVRVDKGTGLATPIVDGQGQRTLGKDSQLASDRKMAQSMTGMIKIGRELLKKGPTASGAGAFIDKINSMTGISTESGNVAASLDSLGAWMTSNVPRMQGPQSDKDTLLYRQMGGIIGDRTQPVSARMAALDTVELIMRRSGAGYTGAAPYDKNNQPPMATPDNPAKPSLDSFFK